jgi:hypothetical protein
MLSFCIQKEPLGDHQYRVIALSIFGYTLGILSFVFRIRFYNMETQSLKNISVNIKTDDPGTKASFLGSTSYGNGKELKLVHNI